MSRTHTHYKRIKKNQSNSKNAFQRQIRTADNEKNCEERENRNLKKMVRIMHLNIKCIYARGECERAVYAEEHQNVCATSRCR